MIDPYRWERFFYDMALKMATRSKDPNTRVGALIVSADRRWFAPGYNGFPPGIADDERLHSPDKNKMMTHAEANAIANCPWDAKGASIYITKFPCAACAGLILSARIARVIAPPWNPESEWAESHQLAKGMLHEGGVLTPEIVGQPL